jgi:hypothetical protein
MKFEITLGENDRERYGEKLVLDMGKLMDDTDCDTLIAWEDEADYTLYLLRVQGVLRPARWKRALVWFALKQSGADVTFKDLKLRGTGSLRVVDADPPDQSSSEDPSESAS